MDDEQSPTRSSGSLSIVRAAAVLILFVVAVTVLVAVGTRPSVSSTPGTTTTTAAAGAASTTTTTAAGAHAAASTTTTTAGHTTTTKAGHKGTGTTTTTVAPSSVSVVVANATSVNGLAAHYSTVIGAGGWSMQTPVDAATSETTSAVYYASGMQQPAASIATSIGVKPAQVLPVSASTPVSGVTGTDVVVVIGADLASATTTTVASS
jgi:LytR cell envelope-related transcriptional attenuator